MSRDGTSAGMAWQPGELRHVDELLGSATVGTFVAGDRVLVALGGDAARVRTSQMKSLRDVLRGRFPGVEFTVVAGVTAVAVQHAGDVGAVVTSPEPDDLGQRVSDALDDRPPPHRDPRLREALDRTLD